jgi:putative MATE family efflux protein
LPDGLASAFAAEVDTAGKRAYTRSMRAPASPLVTGPIGRTLTRLAVPAVAAMFIQTAMSFAEAWYLGHAGPAALAGAALVFPLFMLTNMLSGGALGSAVAGAVARALGAGDRARAEAVLRQALLLALGGGVVWAVVFHGFGQAIFAALGGAGAVLDAALRYAEVLFTCSITIWLFNLLASAARGAGRMGFAAGATTLVTAVHLPLAGLLILGAGPVPAMGMTGAAVASVVAYGAGAAWLLYDLRFRPGPLRLSFGGGWSQGIAEILQSGMPALLSPFLTVAAILLLTAIVGRLGPAALAGYGIGARLEFMMIPLIFGTGSALIAMVGANVGAGRRDRAIAVAWRGCLAAGAITGAIGIVLAIWPWLWADLFTADAGIRAATRTYLTVVGPFYAFFGLGLSMFFASFGLKTVIWPVIGGLLRLVVIAAGGAWLLQADGDLASLCAVVAAAMVAYGGFAAVALRLGPWRPGRPAGAMAAS